jgi:hypothetical protein
MNLKKEEKLAININKTMKTTTTFFHKKQKTTCNRITIT